MNWRSLKSFIPAFSPVGLGALVAVLGMTFLTTVLIPGIELASELVESTAALKLVADQQRYPTLLQSSLEVMRDRLNNRGYLQEAADQLRDAVQKVDAALPAMTAPRPASWFALAGDTGATAESIAGRSGAQLRELWAREQAVLEPLVGFSGVPYKDSESTGTALNDNGRQLERDIAAAARTSHHVLPELDALLLQISARLQSGNVQAAKELQLVLFMGLLIAAVLVLLVLLMIGARQRQDASLREARQQTMDILRTVKDGLLLLDRNLVIGTTFSSALETLFQRRDIAGLSFESLLKNIVSEKTLDTALKFVTILWLERTNEKLVKSINPLGEVEVHLDTGGGKFETRFLQFEFHRVRVDGRITHILVSVSDVSSRVELARELQNSQSQAQAQVDTLLGILHIDPVQLASFLNDSNAAMKMINAVLREPAREEGAFRKKLDTLFRQAHSVKGEAAALGLSSIESRAHSFEDDLKLLRERPGLSGNDFLPLVIKLDDLLTHLQSVSELVSRLSKFQVPQTEIAFARRRRRRRLRPAARRRSTARRCSAAPMEDCRPGWSSSRRGWPRRAVNRRACTASAWTRYPKSIGGSSRTSQSKPYAMPSSMASRLRRRGSRRESRQPGWCDWFSKGLARRVTNSASKTTDAGWCPSASRRWRSKKASSLRNRRRTSTRSKRSRCCSGPGSPRSKIPPRMPAAASG